MSILDTFSNSYWKKRFTRTFGYLLYKEVFSPRDLLNARYHYGRDIDEKIVGVVTHRFESMDTEEMWSGIAAPYGAFFSQEWREYTEKGKDLREKALVKLLTSKAFPESLTREEIIEAKEDAAVELLNSGYHVPLGKKAVPKKIPPQIDYSDYRGYGVEEEI